VKLLERIFLIGSALALTACLLGFLWRPAAEVAPLIAEQPVVQAQNAKPGASATGTFTLIANQPVEVLRVITSCGCAAVDLREKSLTSGQRTKLTLKWTIPDSSSKTKEAAAKACIMYRVLDARPGKKAIQHLVVALNAEYDDVESK
jgi:hypothetical protein